MKTNTMLPMICALTCLLAPGAGAATSPAPGVEFTQVQDLNSDAKPLNRAIKQKWAIVIGASRFKEKRLDNELPNMDAAAKKFYEYLVDPDAGRFDPHHVKLLVNDSATRQNIMSDLGSHWLGQLAGSDDFVVVFIATSSFPTTDGSTYLCAYDCALDNVYGTCISMQSLMDTLKRDVPSDRILLVLQSCYSGAAKLTEGSKALYSGYNVDVKKIALGKGYIILSSSMPDQRTLNDSFSNNLVASLRQQNGLIPLRQAFEEARAATERDSLDADKNKPRQTPVMMADWSGNDLVVGTPAIEKISGLPDNVLKNVSAESCYLEATKLIGNSDIDGALAKYKEAIEIDPTYADALADDGAALWIKKDFTAAADMYRRAIAVKPDDSLFHANYARVLDSLGDKDQATDQLERAYELNPKDKIVLTALAQRALMGGEPDRAVVLLIEGANLYPDSSSMHALLSVALAQTGNYDHALAEARQATKLDPDSASAHLNLGSCFLQKGDATTAVSEYERALQLDPQNSDVCYLLSRAYKKLGNKQLEIAELKRFLQLCSPADPKGTSAQKRLQELK